MTLLSKQYFSDIMAVSCIGGGNQCTRRKWNIPSPIIQSNPKTDHINFRKSSKVIGFSDHEGHIYNFPKNNIL
jgi:hypothetical protein